MARIVFTILCLWSIAYGQSKVLMEGAQRKPLSDTSTSDQQTGAISWWGDSMTAGFGLGSADSSIVRVFKFISGYYGFNLGVSGETSTQIKNRFIANPQYWLMPQVIWFGRNSPDSATDNANLRQIVDTLNKYQNDRYLILTVINRTDEPNGSPGFNTIRRINNGYFNNFPGHVFDVRRFIINSYNPSLPADVTAYNDSVPPPSLMQGADQIHLNGMGYRLAAQKIYSDWTTTFTGTSVMSEVAFRQFFKAPRLNTDNNQLLNGDHFNLQNGRIGLGSTTFINQLTFGASTANNGIRMYRTVDEVTNREWVEFAYAGNTYPSIVTGQSGTGAGRGLRLGSAGTGAYVDIGPVIGGGFGKGTINLNGNLFGGGSGLLGITGSAQSTGLNNGFINAFTVNKSATGQFRGNVISLFKAGTDASDFISFSRYGHNSASNYTGVDTGYHEVLYDGTTVAVGGAFFGADKNISTAPTKKANALLQLNSLSQGVIFPRMSSSQRLAISVASTDSSLVVWDKDSSRLMVYNGNAWKGLAYTDQSAVYINGSGIGLTGNTFSNLLTAPISSNNTIYGSSASNGVLTIQSNTTSGSNGVAGIVFNSPNGTALAQMFNSGVTRFKQLADSVITFTGSTNVAQSGAVNTGTLYEYAGSTGSTLTIPDVVTISGFCFTVVNKGTADFNVSVNGGGAIISQPGGDVNTITLPIGGSAIFTWSITSGRYLARITEHQTIESAATSLSLTYNKTYIYFGGSANTTWTLPAIVKGTQIEMINGTGFDIVVNAAGGASDIINGGTSVSTFTITTGAVKSVHAGNTKWFVK